jgi:endo-1,4-beta-xylanase
LAAYLPIAALAEIAKGQSKFLGSAINGTPASHFSTYWNQLTPENAGKWGSVEAVPDVMNWGPVDTQYNYAQTHGYKFKGHTLVWGSQYPTWLTSSGLSQAQQRAQIQSWIQQFAQRYPNTWAVDVVNEPIKTPLPFKAALGGDGATGYDWVITAFQMARAAFPASTKLFINEYGTENDAAARAQYLNIVNLLKARGLIDGVGVQAHYFNLDGMSASQMTTALNAYASTGVDVYVSELDLTGGGTDAGQLAKYQELFPVIWTHPAVKGVTLWGYVVGQTWRSGTGLLNSNGTERPALTWLKTYVPSTGGDTRVWLEAERGTVGSTWNDNIPDAAASAGQYVTVKPGNNSLTSAPATSAGWVSLPFRVSASGTYRVWIRKITPTANDDSFWVRMDNGSFVMWNSIPASPSWSWAQFPSTFNLGAGAHTLVLGYREDGARVDKIYITNGTDTPSGIGGTASN